MIQIYIQVELCGKEARCLENEVYKLLETSRAPHHRCKLQQPFLLLIVITSLSMTEISFIKYYSDLQLLKRNA